MATYFENLVFLVTLCIVLIGQVLGGVDYMDVCNIVGMTYNKQADRYEKEMEQKCGMCYCYKGGAGRCTGCDATNYGPEYEASLIKDNCYLSEENELTGYPKCCKNNKICKTGLNSAFFNEEKFNLAKEKLKPFMALEAELATAKMRLGRHRNGRRRRPGMRRGRKMRLRKLRKLQRKLRYNPWQFSKVESRKSENLATPKKSSKRYHSRHHKQINYKVPIAVFS